MIINVLTLSIHLLSAFLLSLILSPSLGESVMVIWQAIGGLAGIASMLWLIVDWARKDERIKAQDGRLAILERRVDTLENEIEDRDIWLMEQVSGIAIAIARIETHLGIEPNKTSINRHKK